MKPLKLTLTAFGSFAGTETVDFEALAPRGVFVVSGPTGTGKTTIFDAMCWALYGEMPLKESSHVRSHHVEDGVPTSVAFEFACGGERYTVTRSPEQLRPAKRGSRLVNDPARASLVRHTAGGGTESIAERSAVKKVCTELLGLDAHQFQRVVLLPQGEFARFLLADTPEREKLLSQLFGTDVFDRIVEHLKTELGALKSEVGIDDTLMANALASARTRLASLAAMLDVAVDLPEELDRAPLAGHLESLGPMVDQSRIEHDRLARLATAATTETARATGAAERFDAAVRARAALGELAAHEDAVEARRLAVEAATQAVPVVDAARAADVARTEAEQATQRRDDLLASLIEGFSSLGRPFDPSTVSVTTVNRLFEECRGRQASDRSALEAVRAAQQERDEAVARRDDLDRKLHDTRAELAREQTAKVDLEQRLSELGEGAARRDPLASEHEQLGDRLAARRELDAVVAKHEAAKVAAATAADEHQRCWELFVATEAPRLAVSLRPGEPCRVCGATEHPAPAVPSEGKSVSYDDVSTVRAAEEEAVRELHAIEAELVRLRTRLGDDVEQSAAELEQRRSQIAEQLAHATRAAEQLEAAKAALEKLTADIATCDRAVATLESRVDHADRDAASAAEQLTVATKAAEGVDPSEVERRDQVLAGLGQPCGDLEDVLATADRAEVHRKGCAQRVVETLDASPFASVDDARTAWLEPAVIDEHRAAVRRHDGQKQKAITELEVLEGQGIPEERPDVGAAKSREREARQQADRAADRCASAEHLRDEILSHLDDYDKRVEASGQHRAQAALLGRVYAVCAKGGSSADLSLKRWVLTRELDRVTDAANVHLRRMTAERYTLRRVEERHDGRRAFGLDLEVLDAHTARPRPTTSLSGGEQFQASLALALGLADVVSRGGTTSGKSFEALFVDEGFGSLSAEALDDAVNTLYELNASGRMVGAITHVEAMKQDLHVGIEVRHRDDGPGSTLVVHP